MRRRHLQRSRGTGRHSHFAHTRTARGRRARATPPHTTRYPLRARLLRARAHPRPHFPRVAGRPPPLLSPEAHELILFVCVHATCPRERLVVVPQGRVWTDRAGGVGDSWEGPVSGRRPASAPARVAAPAGLQDGLTRARAVPAPNHRRPRRRLRLWSGQYSVAGPSRARVLLRRGAPVVCCWPALEGRQRPACCTGDPPAGDAPRVPGEGGRRCGDPGCIVRGRTWRGCSRWLQERPQREREGGRETEIERERERERETS